MARELRWLEDDKAYPSKVTMLPEPRPDGTIAIMEIWVPMQRLIHGRIFDLTDEGSTPPAPPLPSPPPQPPEE